MMSFIEKPNLPMGEVKSVICGVLCRELEDFLDLRKIKRYKVEDNPFIDKATATHADMLALHIKENNFIVDSQQIELIRALEQDGACVIKTEKPIKGEYPKDIGLNFAVMGDCVFGKISCCDKNLLRELEPFNKYNCNQGYCKCSCFIIDENAIITDDESIFNIAQKAGKDCLLISKGDVLLPGHEYGFIGGAAAKISKNEILFFGDITCHRDYERINAFILKYGCGIISLDFPLTDFGGLVLVEEKIEAN